MSSFKITHYTIVSDKCQRLKRPYRFALLADLHDKAYGPGGIHLLEAVHQHHPDCILSAGDLIVSNTNRGEVRKSTALEIIRQLAGEYPFYYGNGNHEQRLHEFPETFPGEYQAFTEELCSAGVQLLVNQHLTFSMEHIPVAVYGFESDWTYYKKYCRCGLSSPQLTEVLGDPDPGVFNILLAHNPVYFPAYARWGADLTVSGHLHGGIIRIPGIGGLITPQAKLFPKYDAGHFTEQGKHLIVSRGLGTHTVNLRVFNPAELIFIDITGEGHS